MAVKYANRREQPNEHSRTAASFNVVKHKLETQEKREEILFNKEAITLVLSVNPDITHLDRLQNLAEKYGLFRKEEFHITLIGRETGEIIKENLNKYSGEERDRFLLEIQKLAQNFNWSCIFRDEYYFISKEYADIDRDNVVERRQSYIQLIELLDLKKFYERLNQLLHLDLDVPFPHVTLFTTSTHEDKKLRGIGIYSREQFESLTPQKLIL